jgi:hypothetical protein
MLGEVPQTHDIGNSARMVPDRDWIIAKIALLSKCHNPGIAVEIKGDI